MLNGFIGIYSSVPVEIIIERINKSNFIIYEPFGLGRFAMRANYYTKSTNNSIQMDVRSKKC